MSKKLNQEFIGRAEYSVKMASVFADIEMAFQAYSAQMRYYQESLQYLEAALEFSSSQKYSPDEYNQMVHTNAEESKEKFLEALSENAEALEQNIPKQLHALRFRIHFLKETVLQNDPKSIQEVFDGTLEQMSSEVSQLEFQMWKCDINAKLDLNSALRMAKLSVDHETEERHEAEKRKELSEVSEKRKELSEVSKSLDVSDLARKIAYNIPTPMPAPINIFVPIHDEPRHEGSLISDGRGSYSICPPFK